MKAYLALLLALSFASCSAFKAEPGDRAAANQTDDTAPDDDDSDDVPIITPPTTTTATFNQVYNQALKDSCAATCHNDDSGMNGGLVMLDISQQIVAYGNLVGRASGIYGGETRVIAGNAAGSLLVKKLEGDPTVGARMPAGAAPLSAAQIQLVKDWIAAGAKND